MRRLSGAMPSTTFAAQVSSAMISTRKRSSFFLSLLLLHLCHASPASRQLSKGLTLDLCRATVECDDDSSRSGYFCKSVNRGTAGALCEAVYPTCRCIPRLGFPTCTTDDDCVEGEVCARYTQGEEGAFAQIFSLSFQSSEPFCVSADAEKQLSDVELVSSSSSPTGSETIIDFNTSITTKGGLKLDTCTSDEGCAQDLDPQECVSFNAGTLRDECAKEHTTCRCYSVFDGCESDLDCIVGEVCGIYIPGEEGPVTNEFPGSSRSFCVSEKAEKSFSDIERFPLPSPSSKPTGTESVVDSVNPLAATGGLTLDECGKNVDCLMEESTQSNILSCRTFEDGNVGKPCEEEGGQSCRCMRSYFELVTQPIRFCIDNSFCLVGEGCAKYSGERGSVLTQVEEFDFTRPFCISVKAADEFDDIDLIATPSPPPSKPTESKPSQGSGDGDSTSVDESEGDDTMIEDQGESNSGGDNGDEVGNGGEGDNGGEGATTEDEVCVDSRLVSHMPPTKLVFKKHVLAKVLCDETDSCATKGHIVIYKGDPMRMSAYCKLVQCREKTLHVNSPRYERGMRVLTRTEGLEFTAFAARYDTVAEEMVLAGGVRVGL